MSDKKLPYHLPINFPSVRHRLVVFYESVGVVEVAHDVESQLGHGLSDVTAEEVITN